MSNYPNAEMKLFDDEIKVEERAFTGKFPVAVEISKIYPNKKFYPPSALKPIES